MLEHCYSSEILSADTFCAVVTEMVWMSWRSAFIYCHKDPLDHNEMGDKKNEIDSIDSIDVMFQNGP